MKFEASLRCLFISLFFPPLPGVEREPVDSETREARMVDPSEGMSAADAGRGRGQPAQEAEAVLRAAVSPVQEEDAAGSPQPGAGPAQRGKNFRCSLPFLIIVLLCLFSSIFDVYMCMFCGSTSVFFFFLFTE